MTRGVAKTHTHEQAVRHLRAGRPTGEGRGFDASEFWRQGEYKNRCLLLYALLTRPGTITDFIHQDENPRLLPDVSKLYTFLREWGIDYKAFRPPPRIDAVGADHRLIRGILRHDDAGYYLDTGARRMRLQYLAWGEWRVIEDPGVDVPLQTALHAARIAGIEGDDDTLTRHLDQVSINHCGFGIARHPEHDARVLPRAALDAALGENTVEAASIHANVCRCQFWDDLRLRCGIDPRRKLIPSACPDYMPLEVSWSASKSPHVQRALASPAPSEDAQEESSPPPELSPD